MFYMSQTQIAQCLQDYSELTSLMLEYPNANPYLLFEMYLTKENRQDQINTKYYNQIIDIAYMYTKMKMFSIAEDYNVKKINKFINDEDLDLSFLDEHITGNKRAYSKQQIITELRNKFNHSEEGNELYKIPHNCKYIKFSFKGDNPIRIKIPIEEISSLTSLIGNKTRTIQNFNFDEPEAQNIHEYLDKIKITRYYFSKKLLPNTKEQILTLQDQGKYEEANDIMKATDGISEKEIPLTEEQKNNILKTLNQLLEKKIITEKELKEHYRDITIILINKELSVPILKVDNYLLDSFLLGSFLPSKIKSYSQMYNDFLNGLNSDKPNIVNKHKNIFTKYRELLFKTYMPNAREKEAYSSLLFVEYIITNFKPTDQFIEIDNQTIEYRKLRNSLVHGRWHTKDDKIYFYDTFPKTQNELDDEDPIKLTLTELKNYCKNILENKLEKPKQKLF